jgi:hypothetical protein
VENSVEDFGQAQMLTAKRGKRTACCIRNFLEENFSHQIASQFVAPSSVRSRHFMPMVMPFAACLTEFGRMLAAKTQRLIANC